MNVLQRVASAEEDFYNYVDRITCSVDTTQSLSSATPSLANELMNEMAMVAGMVVIHGLSNMDFRSSGMTGCSYC